MSEHDLKRRVMVHESGHAVGAWAKGWDVLGIVEHVGMDRQTFGEGEGITRYTFPLNASPEARADVLAAGWAAELALLGVQGAELATADLEKIAALCPCPGDPDAARRWVEARMHEAIAVATWHKAAINELVIYMQKSNGCVSRWVGEAFRAKHFS